MQNSNINLTLIQRMKSMGTRGLNTFGGGDQTKSTNHKMPNSLIDSDSTGIKFDKSSMSNNAFANK